MFNVAIILGAGNGTRMGIEKSKLLLEIGGKTVIERTVDVFENCPEIDEIIVVCRECDIDVFSRLLPDDNISFVIGGATRQESVANAIEAIEECDFVVIHDGARPFVTEDVIINTLDKAQLTKAAATGVMVKDTIKVVNENLDIVDTPDEVNSFQYKLLRFSILKHIKKRLKRQMLRIKIILMIASLLKILDLMFQQCSEITTILKSQLRAIFRLQKIYLNSEVKRYENRPRI